MPKVHYYPHASLLFFWRNLLIHLGFLKSLYSGEVKQRILALPVLPLQGKDRVIWQPSPAGSFTVSSTLETLRPLSNPLISRKLIWDKRLLLKVSIFMWRLLNDLLPFPDILRRFGLHLPSKCPFCPNEDSLTHCFVECQAASQVWGWFEQGLELHVGTSDSLMVKLQGWWMHSSRRSLRATCTHLLPMLICWELWKARYKTVHENIVSSPAQVRRQVLGLLNGIGAAYLFPPSASQESTWQQLG